MVAISRHHRPDDRAFVVLLLALFACCSSVSAVAQPRPPYTVLIVSQDPGDPVGPLPINSIIETLRSRSDLMVEHFTEYVTPAAAGGLDASLTVRDSILRKYRGRRIDVVIAYTTLALEFVSRHREELFPATPIVFFATDVPAASVRQAGAGITGVHVGGDLHQTLELALRLHPSTKRVYVLVGTPYGRSVSAYRRQLESFAHRVQLTYVGDLPLRELIAAVQALPADSLIFLIVYRQNAVGPAFSEGQIEEMITSASPVPVYGTVEGQLGNGIVGGFLRPLGGRGPQVQVARMALRILGGERAQDIPIEPAWNVPMFDWRQIRRWHIDVSQLPSGSDIRFREPTAWERYRWQIVGTLIVVALQTAMIVGLIIQRARRRETQQNLLNSQDRYALATSAGGVAVWDWNLETNKIYVDPGLKAILGYQQAEVGDRVEDWSRLIYPDDLPVVKSRVREHFAHPHPVYEGEHRMLHRDGTVRWFLVRASTVRQEGRAVRVFGTTTDVTERKRAEQQLHQVQDELARASRLTALGEFAASIAHEVRQPLTAIITSARASLRFLSSGATGDAREALSYVLDAGKRANEVIEHNRLLFRLHTLQKEPLDINSVIIAATVMTRPRLQSGQVALVTSLAEALPSVEGDRIQLQQVLLNLIVNAIDAMDSIDPAARRLEIATVLAASGAVRVSVSDNGIGLGAVDMQRMFTLSYTTKATGTGVGLSISRTIVEAHGGKLWAEGNAQGGATFAFTIPTLATMHTARQQLAG